MCQRRCVQHAWGFQQLPGCAAVAEPSPANAAAMDFPSDVCLMWQEALLGERGKLLEALQREEAHAAAVAAACNGAGASAAPAGHPGADPAAPADAGPPAGGSAAGAMAVDGAAVEAAAGQGGGAAGGGAEPAADAGADALDAYMSAVRTQIELDKARPGYMRYALSPT